ncbi:MAG: carboxypeptidase regulatory-like domain-containing protein [Planctomycetes bacterium]|nr:carboxypeptidase regulatory-like domain-containing protein [Planctomycetota bacterium]
MRRRLAAVVVVLVVAAVVFLALAWRDSGGAGVAAPPPPADTEFGAPDVGMVASDAPPVRAAEPEPAPAAPSWSLPDVLVTVVDAHGARVAGATVSATRGGQPVATALTDEAGCCRIDMSEAPWGRCDLRAEKADLRSQPLQVPAGEQVVLRLLETLSLVLRVVDDVSGEGVPECAIHVVGESDWEPWSVRGEQFVTGEDGSCRADVTLPLGELVVSRPGYVLRNLVAPPSEVVGEPEFVIRLTPASCVRIHVHDAVGQEIAGAVFGDEKRPGHFVAAPCQTRAVSGRMVYEVRWKLQPWSEVRAAGWATQPLAIPRSWDDTQVLEMELRPGARVIGQIERSSGLAYSMCRVRANDQEGTRIKSSFSVQPAVDGAFIVDGAERGREYALVAHREGYLVGRMELRVAEDAEVVDLGLVDLGVAEAAALSAMKMTVEGIVVEEGGGPLAGAWVVSSRQDTCSDGEGRFQLLTEFGEGVWVGKQGYECARSMAWVGEGTVIALRPAALIHGQVMDDRGLPVLSASLRLLPDLHRPGCMGPMLKWRTWTDRNGKFVIGRRGLYKESLRVHAEGFSPVDVQVPAGEEYLVVKVARSAFLRVERAAGFEPPPGGRWEVWALDDRWARASVPAGERAVWVRVPPGRCTLRVDVPGHDPVETVVDVSAGITSHVRVGEEDR